MLHDTHDIYRFHLECSRPRDDDPVIIRRPRPSDVGAARSFQIQSHNGGRTLPWCPHPDYEIHLVAGGATGRMFIGDYLGRFEPRSSIMIGPNVPYWIGTNRPGAKRGCHCVLIQFTSDFIDKYIDRFLELHTLHLLMLDARRGVTFSERTINLAWPIIVALQHLRGFERIKIFLKLLGYMSESKERRLLSSVDYKRHRPIMQTSCSATC